MIVTYRGLSIYFPDGTPDELVTRAIDEAFGEAGRVEALEAALAELVESHTVTRGRADRAGDQIAHLVDALIGDRAHRMVVVDPPPRGVLRELAELAEAVAAHGEALEVEASRDADSRLAAVEVALEASFDWRAAARAMAAALALDREDPTRSLAYNRAATVYRAAGAEPPAVDRAYSPDELEAIRTAPGPHDDDEAEFAVWARKAIRDLRHAVNKLRKAGAAAEG